MRFLIDSRSLGTAKTLLCDGGKLSWVSSDEPSGGLLRWRSAADTLARDDLRTAMLLSGHDVPWRFDKKYINALRLTLPDFESRDIPWHLIAPAHVMSATIKSIVSGVKSCWTDIDTTFYNNVFSTQTTMFESLVGPTISRKRIEKYLKEDKNRSTFLSGFLPDEGDTLPKITYHRVKTDSHCGTVTGRLTTATGPDFLTLNREYRNILKSRWDRGTVWYLDYSSLEPRTFQAHIGRKLPENFYSDLAENTLGDRGRVADAKAMFLRRFYGSGVDSLLELGVSSREQVTKFVKHVDEDFGVREMSNRLVREFSETGKIRNRYGRAVLVEKGAPPHLLFNNWVQSSAVDAALLGFAAITSAVKRSNLEIEPLCIIHDAIVIDVHPRCQKYVEVLKSVGARVPGFENFEFEMHAERIT